MSRRTRIGRPIRNVLVVAKIGAEEGVRIADDLGTFLRRRRIRVRFDAETSRLLGRRDGVPRTTVPTGTDLVVVAGGDGTLLSVARAAAPRRVPILGVNFGGLGFLTELQPDELVDGVERVLRGEYALDERRALAVVHRRSGRRSREHVLLNDAVITKGALARMITIGLRVDGDPVATYTSDGLIVATSTGSTAYSLSAGGPILDPRVGAFVIAPICPHTMTHRPLVVPGSVRIDVELQSPGEPAFLTLDGQIGIPMRQRDTMEVRTYTEPVRLVRVAGRSFFEVLRGKLHWGGR